MKNKDLKRRIIEIAYKNKLSHLGSYISTVDTIDFIFNNKQKDDIFILSNGHAAIAQYVVLEKYYNCNAEKLFYKHGGHPHLDEDNHIYCSTGSLGMGISIAIGRALSNVNRTVHVMLSDGECAEGVVWESLRFISDHPVNNIKIYVIHNGYGAYCEISYEKLKKRLNAFSNNDNIQIINNAQSVIEEFPFLKGLNAHYHIMKEKDYELAMEILK
jgi:transketolase